MEGKWGMLLRANGECWPGQVGNAAQGKWGMLPRTSGECCPALGWAALKPLALTTAAEEKVTTKIIILLCCDQGWRDDEAGLTLQQQQERAVSVVLSQLAVGDSVTLRDCRCW